MALCCGRACARSIATVLLQRALPCSECPACQWSSSLVCACRWCSCAASTVSTAPSPTFQTGACWTTLPQQHSSCWHTCKLPQQHQHQRQCQQKRPLEAASWRPPHLLALRRTLQLGMPPAACRQAATCLATSCWSTCAAASQGRPFHQVGA